MKEIGEKLKEARDNIGISVEEASEDLKVLPSQIEALEAGETDKFKDMLSVKHFIREYAKYLGLSYDDIVDEFNEYLFDYTSKLSIDDIKKAQKKDKQDEKNKIMSPYTLEYKKPKNVLLIIFIVLVTILILSVVYFAKTNNNSNPSNMVTTAN